MEETLIEETPAVAEEVAEDTDELTEDEVDELDEEGLDDL